MFWGKLTVGIKKYNLDGEVYFWSGVPIKYYQNNNAFSNI